MRINLLQGAFLPVPPLRGGAVERIWDRLGQEFAATGHTVTQISRAVPELPRCSVTGGVNHVRVPGFDQPSNLLLLKARDLIYTWRALRVTPTADVVVTNTFWAPLLLRRHQGAIVVDVGRMPRGQLKWYRRVARFRANSRACGDAIAAELGGATDRILLTPNPLTFTPVTSRPIQEREKIVLYAGRLHPEKGLECLLAAWRQLRERGAIQDWRLRIVGPLDPASGGGGATWWNKLQQRYGHDGVEVLPPLYAEASLYAHYAAARLFVYPSLAQHGETFGSAVLEALSHGTPAVVSRLACFTDFVVPGQNGWTFDHAATDPATKLATTLGDTLERDLTPHSLAASAVNRTHHPNAIAQDLLRAFGSLRAASPST